MVKMTHNSAQIELTECEYDPDGPRKATLGGADLSMELPRDTIVCFLRPDRRGGARSRPESAGLYDELAAQHVSTVPADA